LGLLGLLDTPDKLAAVLAHELTHVTQRHISRSIARQEKQAPLLLASMVLGVLAAKNNNHAANAVIASSQAIQIQGQLNYSRDMEREADRIGFNLMQAAGFDPKGFVGLLQLLQQSARLSDSGRYPYLRTHPLNTERIGDADVRLLNTANSGVATNHSNVSADKNMVHHMMAARARVFSEPDADTMRLWANASIATGATASTANKDPARMAVVHYAAVLVHMRFKDFEHARVSMGKLREAVGGHTKANHHANLLEMELALAVPSSTGNKSMLQKMLPLLSGPSDASPSTQLKNRAELFLLSQAHLVNNEADKATSALRAWVAIHPQDALVWQLLSKAYAAQKQTIRAIRAEAEGQVALMDYAAALDRYGAAQELAKNFVSTQDRDFIEESIVDVRTRQVQELLSQQRQYEKDAVK